MNLSKFADICEDLVSTRSTNYKQDAIADVYEHYDLLLGEIEDNGDEISHQDSSISEELLPEADPVQKVDVAETVEIFTRFIVGERFEEPERKTNFKDNRMFRSAASSFGISTDEIKESYNELGKASAAVGDVYGGQSRLVEVSDRTIRDVYEVVCELPDAEGDTEREKMIEELLSDCKSPKEAKWVSFCVLGDISMYMGWKTAADAMSDVWDLDVDDIRRARRLSRGDFPSVVRQWIDSESLRLDLEIGVPFDPMLASSAELDEIGGDYVGQPKFDGARVLVHSDGEEIRIFTRGLRDVTESLPEITEALDPEREFILDGEVVAYDADTGDVLPFEKIMNRLGREHDIDATRDEVEAKVWFFDCVYRDEPMDNRSFFDRKEALTVTLRESADVEMEEWRNTDSWYWSGETVRETPTLGDLNVSFSESTVDHEGIIAKDPDSHYTFDRDESWIKVKPEETIDLRVTTARRGDGENAQRLGRLYLETKDGVEVGRVGNGFSDEEREKWDPVDGRDLAGEIVEITAEEMSVTGDDGDQYGVRFPRFERLRDKNDASPDSLDRCIELLN